MRLTQVLASEDSERARAAALAAMEEGEVLADATLPATLAPAAAPLPRQDPHAHAGPPAPFAFPPHPAPFSPPLLPPGACCVPATAPGRPQTAPSLFFAAGCTITWITQTMHKVIIDSHD